MRFFYFLFYFYFNINHLQEEISVKFSKTSYSKDWSVHFQMMTAWNHFDCASPYNSYDSRSTTRVKSFLVCMCFAVLETQNGCLVIQAWTIRWLNCVGPQNSNNQIFYREPWTIYFHARLSMISANLSKKKKFDIS